jgi:cobalt-zinc-cadmium efflux system outer membrane protein
MSAKLFQLLAPVLCLLTISGHAQAKDRVLGTPAPPGFSTGLAAPPAKTDAPAAAGKLSLRGGELTLAKALSWALRKNPELAAYSWEKRVKAAETMQAGLLPNPELEVGSEEFGGAADRQSFDAAQFNFLLSQKFELGNKRGKRTKAAKLAEKVADWDFKSKRLDVAAQTSKSFFRLLAAQERTKLASDTLKLARLIHETVRQRVEAGKISPVELTKARITLAQARIAMERAQRDLLASRTALTANWGATRPMEFIAKGDLENLPPVPPLINPLSVVSRNPDLARKQTVLDFHNAVIEREEAYSVPDPTVTVGLQRFQDAGENTFALGFSVPLPFFDRNQGATLAARRRLSQTQKNLNAAEVAVKSALRQNHQRLLSSYQQALSLQSEVLPASREALRAVTLGFKEGKFGYLDVLDAQRTLFAVRSQHLDALERFHLNRIEVQRLIGAAQLEKPRQSRPGRLAK